jgi:hypothetical protein
VILFGRAAHFSSEVFVWLRETLVGHDLPVASGSFVRFEQAEPVNRT